MPFNSNFDSPLQIIDGGVVVKGGSDGLENGELVSRNVVLHQDDIIVQGPTNPALKWASGRLGAVDLHAGPALAIGSETYLVVSGSPAVAAFATFTWSETVTLEED